MTTSPSPGPDADPPLPRSTTPAGTPQPPQVPGLRLSHLLGTGAHGAVWRAVEIATGAGVAVKVAHEAADGSPATQSTLSREAALLRQIEHPHLVRVHRVVDLPDGRRALVLGLAEQGSLADLLARCGPLTPGEAVTMLVPLARALAELHGRGLVHADLSPGNVLITADGRPLLSDLGAARVLGVPAGPAHGHDGFAAPEVLAGSAASPASDVFSLGALGRAALRDAGSTLLPGADLAAGGWADPGAGSGFDRQRRDLEQALDACMDPDRECRPSAQEAAALIWAAASAAPLPVSGSRQRLEASRTGVRPDADVTRRIRVAAAEALQAQPDGAGGSLRRRLGQRLPRRRPVLIAGAAALAVGVLVLTGVGVASAVRDGPEPSAATPSGTPSGAAGTADALPPVEALSALATARAAAIMARDATLLQDVADTGSPALAADEALLERLEGEQVRLEGVAYEVSQVRLLRWAGAAAVVGATIATSEHEQVRDGGARVRVPEGRAEVVEVTLVPSPGAPGWRIREIRSGR